MAIALGAEVTVISTSKSKEADAKRLGAATWENHVFPEPTTGGPRVLCDGTRIGGP